MRTTFVVALAVFSFGCDEPAPLGRPPATPISTSGSTTESNEFHARQERLAQLALARATTDDDLAYVQKRFPLTKAAAEARVTRTRQRIRQAMETARRGDRDMAMRLARDAVALAESTEDADLIAQASGLMSLLQPPSLPPPEPAPSRVEAVDSESPKHPVCGTDIPVVDRPPLLGLAGFSFGMSVQQANSLCRKVGHDLVPMSAIAQFDNAWFLCPDTPVNVGLTSESVITRVCSGSLCYIDVAGSKRDNPDWRSQLASITNDIVRKYGPPSCVTPGEKMQWGWPGPGTSLGGAVTMVASGDFVHIIYASAAFFKEAAPLRARRL